MWFPWKQYKGTRQYCSNGYAIQVYITSNEKRYCNSKDIWTLTLRWCHNGHDGIKNQQPHHCLLNRLFGCRSKKTSKFRVTGLCAGNSPGTGEFPAQMASNAENVSIWWRHHAVLIYVQFGPKCKSACSPWAFQIIQMQQVWVRTESRFRHRCGNSGRTAENWTQMCIL